MKKTLTVLAVVIVLFSTAVLAEDLSAGTDHQDLFRFASFGEAVKAANKTAEAGDTPYGVSSEGYCVALIRRDGRFFRTVAFLDEHGKELYAAYLDARSENGEFAEEEYKTLDAYIMTLPVQYTEELTVVPLSREELDAMAGKTLWDVVLEPGGMQIQGRTFLSPGNFHHLFLTVRNSICIFNSGCSRAGRTACCRLCGRAASCTACKRQCQSQ